MRMMKQRMNQPGQFLRVALAIALAVLCAAPMNLAAAEGAAKSASAAKRAYRRASSARYRGIPTFADSTKEDVADYDDPVVRQAAVDALGRYNGAVVAVDPNSGRILTVVNQKLAFSSGFIPCSTIKPAVAIAALEENLITRDTMLRVSRRKYMNLTEAMARSNNPFFEELGRRLGFETVSKYARLLGIGELAGYNIPEEQPGSFPTEPPARGGVARMSSFGEGIRITPLQMAAMASIFANGGTLYYLQYPRSPEDRDGFTPRIKRQLAIEQLLPEVREGMLAAVLYGTGKSSYDTGGDEMPLGKTGTCSDSTSRVGWFVTYADETHPKIVIAVLLRGNTRRVKGPTAALVAGRIYRHLRQLNYFASLQQPRASATTAATD